MFTDNAQPLLAAEAGHRDHAIIEQLIADLAAGPLPHLPSRRFTANAAWLTLAVLIHNLLRAAGALASAFHARARGAALRRQLINIPARLARHGRGHITLHLPRTLALAKRPDRPVPRHPPRPRASGLATAATHGHHA